MPAFRAFMFVWFIVMLAYSVAVIARDGIDLVTIVSTFIGDVGWAGQFSLDLLGFLILTAVWVAWRHGFSPKGLAIAALTVSGGMITVSLYLLQASLRSKGDAMIMLIGPERAKTA